MEENCALATFAGGCFWCLKAAFEDLPGVRNVTAGFTGGILDNPTYEEVHAGGTGHCEGVQIVYQPEVVPYETLLKIYWRRIDPTDAEGQFTDRGDNYRTVIFYHTEEQQARAVESKKALQGSGLFAAEIVTEILPAGPFYAADDYHQDFSKNNRAFYCQYRQASGRDDFIEKMWSGK